MQVDFFDRMCEHIFFFRGFGAEGGINHCFALNNIFKVATAAWHYPRLFSSIFFSFFWTPRSPSLIPLAQSMTPSKAWQNKERPLSITLCRAEMSSGVCLLRLKGLHEWWWEHNSSSVTPPQKINGSQHTSFSCPFFPSPSLTFTIIEISHK